MRTPAIMRLQSLKETDRPLTHSTESPRRCSDAKRRTCLPVPSFLYWTKRGRSKVSASDMGRQGYPGASTTANSHFEASVRISGRGRLSSALAHATAPCRGVCDQSVKWVSVRPAGRPPSTHLKIVLLENVRPNVAVNSSVALPERTSTSPVGILTMRVGAGKYRPFPASIRSPASTSHANASVKAERPGSSPAVSNVVSKNDVLNLANGATRSSTRFSAARP
jgi:hypothetical protein